MKRIFCGCLSATLLFSMPSSVAWAAEPRITAVSNVSENIKITNQTVMEFPPISPLETVQLSDEDSLPQVYDPRENIPLNPIQYRKNIDDLWAYQSIAALEISAYKTSTQVQKFSEQHMLASLTFDKQNPYTAARTSGGNRVFSTAYFSRGSGPVLQKNFNNADYQEFLNSNQNTDPSAPENNHYNSALLDVASQTQNYLPVEYLTAANEGTYSHRFSDTESEGLNTNFEKIKQAVYQYGAVVTDYYMHETDDNENMTEFYNPETNAYYFRTNNYNDSGQPCDDNSAPIPANGTITIIGWDDNFPINNFNNHNLPPQNGAWIVRTDRGTDWGDGGYEYISYYDHIIGRNASVYKPDTETYNHIYQYDPLLNLNSSAMNANNISYTNAKFPTDTAWIANRFEKTTNLPETIGAVGFYVQSYDYIAELYIDPAPEGDTPTTALGTDLMPVELENGDLGLPTQITFSSPGYYILKLKKPITISGAFDVILRVENVQDSNKKELSLGVANGNSLSGNITKAEHSFYRMSSSGNFQLLDSSLPSANWNIKAYTNQESASFAAEKTDTGIRLTLKDEMTDKYSGSKMITAFYDKKNCLLDTKITETPALTEIASGLGSFQTEIVQADIPPETAYCRTFIWHDIEKMEPLTDLIAELYF